MQWQGIRWVVEAACGMLAACVSGGCPMSSQASQQSLLLERRVIDNVFDTAPVRGELHPLRYWRVGFEYKCSECHTSIVSPIRQNALVGTHSDVVFDHGLNTLCLNCHHPSNRNAYVDYEGGEIPADQTARVCAKCHGPTYHDWEVGIHGRQNGYWDTSQGRRTKLMCVQCHDPHSPAFKPMRPEPPPRRTRLDLGREGGHG